jgi:hypothetical protein
LQVAAGQRARRWIPCALPDVERSYDPIDKRLRGRPVNKSPAHKPMGRVTRQDCVVGQRHAGRRPVT